MATKIINYLKTLAISIAAALAKYICRVIATLLVWRYFVMLFINGDAYFLAVSQYFFLTYPEDGCGIVLDWVIDNYNLLSTKHKENLLVSYSSWLEIMLQGGISGIWLSLSNLEMYYVVRRSMGALQDSLGLVDFRHWIKFWTCTLYPIMPWSVLYTGAGCYSLTYKQSTRRALKICLGILVGQDVEATDRELVFKFLLALLLEQLDKIILLY